VTVSAAAATASASAEASSFDFVQLLPLLWALGTVAMTARLIRHGLRVRSIVHAGRGKRPVLVSPLIRGPLAAGVFRPVILLPDTSSGWTLSRRRAVVAHEAAHIRRHDPAILFAAHLATAIYWFHPLSWLALARLRAE